MVDNLGIYNSHVDSDYDINKHIEQGVQFKQYGKNIYQANEHNFLQESSSPDWGSVVDAYNGDNSVKKRGLIEGMAMTEDQANFNNLVSQYAVANKTYISTFLNQPHKKYNDLGCWKDTRDRAITGPPRQYGHTPDSCYAQAKARGSDVFALQHGGWCVTNNPGDDYKRHGAKTGVCPERGKNWTNHVYSVNNITYDDSRKLAEADLLIKKNNIMTAADKINNEMLYNNTTQTKLLNAYNDNKPKLHNALEELNKEKNNRKKYDFDTVNGSIESSELKMNSMYYHIFVYLVVAATLLAFIFNIMINPEANVMNAIYVLGALFVVYFISRYYVI